MPPFDDREGKRSAAPRTRLRDTPRPTPNTLASPERLPIARQIIHIRQLRAPSTNATSQRAQGYLAAVGECTGHYKTSSGHGSYPGAERVDPISDDQPGPLASASRGSDLV